MIALAVAVVVTLVAQQPSKPDSAAAVVTAAKAALDGGQPWRASRLLVPVLRDSANRRPATLLLAAEAAGAWGGSSEVDRLLGGAAWVDAFAGGRGRELLVRAALDRGADSLALRYARLAVADAGATSGRGPRLVLLARAFDRLEMRDSAARAYRDAAVLLVPVADWLRFRAYAVTDDSTARAAIAATIASTVARERLPLADAQARERAGDLAGAAARFAALGAWADAFRLRFTADSSDSGRARLRADLAAFLTARSGTADARSAAGALDSFRPLLPREELLVGRSLAVSGPNDRAAAAFARVFQAGQGTPADRLAYATALAALNRYADAALQFKRVGGPPDLAAPAMYGRARAMVRGGQVAEARSVLRQLLAAYPSVADAAAPALLLLADLATDDRRDADARAALLTLAARYPAQRYAPAAIFRAAVISFAAGDMGIAARELDSLARRYPDNPEAMAARYWAGRAYAARGDSVSARARWQDVAARDPLSYYAAAASLRLGAAPWAPAAAADSFARFGAVDSALARTLILADLGMDRESRWEYDRLARDADVSAERLLATAAGFRERGLASRGVQLALRALGRGSPRDARTFRLVYPIVARPALEAYARDEGLDPALVAALIRQESIFTPAATSAAGARGLMQIMPPVGRALASAAAFPLWDPVLLYQPDVNLELGTRHLAALIRRYPQTVRVLAAYNAGTTRVELWSSKIGMDDEELFAERIPFRETRDYVRIIQRNRELYRALYGLAPPRPIPTPKPRLP